MKTKNPIFKKNYQEYLRQLADVDLSARASILGITFDEKELAANIPFFNAMYRVSRLGVNDARDLRPDYGVCVILLKYLLMCPQQVPSQKDWISYRDFADSGQTQDEGLSAYAARAISKYFSGRLHRMEAASRALDGRPPEVEYPYDLSVVFSALPRVPVLLLFNDAEEQFPAQASVLYERRAASFLDAECRVMIDWYLFEHLKKAEKSLQEGAP